MQTKQVIIFCKDLLKGENGIRKGKFGAQCAHASLCAFYSTTVFQTSDVSFLVNTSVPFRRQNNRQ